MQIEVIVTNLEEAILAEQYGASRLELIHDFALGGLSPVLTVSQSVCAAINIPVWVMVRPHGENFVYDEAERAQILREIVYLRDQTQAHGVVFGALNEAHQLDTALLEQVLALKGHLQLTFHRAIDASAEPLALYQQLLQYPDINFVLTSGGKPTALAGMATLQKMVALSTNHMNAQVLAGSGITPDNAVEIVTGTGVKQIHLGTGVRTNNQLDPKKFVSLNNNFACQK